MYEITFNIIVFTYIFILLVIVLNKCSRYVTELFSIYMLMKNKQYVLNNAENILFLFEKSKEIVYLKKFYEYISLELINGSSLENNTLDKMTKEYIDELYLVMGNNLIENLKVLKGDDTSIITELSFEFRNKIIKEDLDNFNSNKNNKNQMEL